MPIKFRCPECRQFLGISRSKAGSITDCPTCGRTLRVPNLDGTVSPLPPPKLNLDDSALRQALGALASLENAEEQSQPDVPDAAGGSDGQHSVIDSSAPQPIAPQPIAVNPPESLDVQVTADPIQAEIEASPEPVALLEEFDRLHESHRQDAKAAARPRSALFGILCVCGVILVFGLGYCVGRFTPSTLRSAEPPQPAPERVDVIPAPAVADGKDAAADGGTLKLSGRITYQTAAGESRPDRGARVMLLPKDREGTAKISEIGFRVGADEADRKLITHSVEALGGKLVLADQQGEYQLTQISPGEYTLLIASRFQPALDSRVIPPRVVDALATYFEKPDRLIGQVQYHFQEVQIGPDSKGSIDHDFSMQ